MYHLIRQQMMPMSRIVLTFVCWPTLMLYTHEYMWRSYWTPSLILLTLFLSILVLSTHHKLFPCPRKSYIRHKHHVSMPNSSVVMTHHSLYMAAIFDAIIVFCENHDVRHQNHIFMFIIFLKL